MRDISWDELDPLAFFGWSATLFMGVRLLVYPTALVKTRLQVDSSRVSFRTLSTLRTIIRTEGVLALYQGFSIVAIGAIPAQALYLSIYERVKHATSLILRRRKFNDTTANALSHLIGGASASIGSQIIVVPIDVVSQRLMIEKRTSKSMFRGVALASQIYKDHGVSGFYRGLLTSILTYAPSSAIYWGTYGLLKHSVPSLSPESELAVSAGCGFLAGSTTAVLTNPMDVIRTRIQILDIQNGSQWGQLKAGFRELLATEGWKGLTRGMGARVLNMGPVSMMMVVTYEIVKKLSLKPEYKL